MTTIQSQSPRVQFAAGIKKSWEDVSLNNQTVQGAVQTSSGEIKIVNTHVAESVSSSSGDIHVQGGRVGGGVSSSSGEVSVTQTPVGGSVQSNSGDVSIKDAQVDGAVKTSSGSVTIRNTPVGNGIGTNGGDISISNSTVTGGIKTSSGEVNASVVDVTGSVETNGGDVTFTQGSRIGRDVKTSSGEVSLTGTPVGGAIQTSGGDITLKNASVGANIKTSSGTLRVTDAQVAGGITTSGGDVTLTKASAGGSIETSSGDVTLQDAKVIGNVKTNSGAVALDNVIVTQKVTMPIRENGSVLFTKATVGDVLVRSNENNINVYSSVVIGGNNTFVSVNGRQTFKISAFNSIEMNGYKISAGFRKTTFRLPDGNEYVNGDKKTGNGPATYAEYRRLNPSAPDVSGPGWSDAGSAPKPKREKQSPELPPDFSLENDTFDHDKLNAMADPTPEPEAPKKPAQTLILDSGSQVTGGVTFEDGNGTVILRNGSSVTGDVVGGKIIRE